LGTVLFVFIEAMPEDILDAAQKAINEAANASSDTPTVSQPTEKPPVLDGLPQEPGPAPLQESPASTVPETPQVSTTPSADEVVIPPSEQHPQPSPTPSEPNPLDLKNETVVNQILGGTTVPPIPADPAPVAPPHHSDMPLTPKKKSGTGFMLAALATLMLTIPIAVYYVSQQNNQIADIRSSAYSGQSCDPSRGENGGCEANEGCSCRNGSCTCGPTGGQDPCYHTICPVNYHCVPNGGGNSSYCTPDTGCTGPNCGGGGDEPTPTPIPPICQNIKIYKNGAQVTPTTLQAGDAVILASKGNLTPTKARFRVNGGAWQETTTQNASNEFTLNYTIPSGITDFVIETEVFTNGAWH
jgi:hypothetical protein